MNPTFHWMVSRTWPQVLGDRDQFTASSVQIDEGLIDLLVGLAHAQNQVALGQDRKSVV
jgi:hypothetical protein